MMIEQRTTKAFMACVLVAGAACLFAAIYSAPFHAFDLQFLLIVGFTIGLGSRITVQIPSLKSHIAVSDTFIFLTLLLYGGSFAIMLAAVEAFFSSLRFCNKKITIFFNVAAMALSTTAVVWALKGFSLYSFGQMQGQSGHMSDFVVALSVIALTQFLTNTSLAAIQDSLKNSVPLWETWKSKYLWIFFSYFIGAGAAGAAGSNGEQARLRRRGCHRPGHNVRLFVVQDVPQERGNVDRSSRTGEPVRSRDRIKIACTSRFGRKIPKCVRSCSHRHRTYLYSGPLAKGEPRPLPDTRL